MDVRDRLAKISFMPVKADVSHLSERERNALRECVQAAHLMTDAYIRQAGNWNSVLRNMLAERTDQEGKDLYRYFMIQGGPWDEFNHDEPFLNIMGPKPKFGSFYPPGMTKEEFGAHLDKYPEDREKFESPYTVIYRGSKPANHLSVDPYSHTFRRFLEKAASCLMYAGSNLPKGALRTFLESRAEAFLSNEYFQSDMDWVDTNGDPFEVTIGPYEVYFDELLGLKAAFEAFIALPDKAATVALTRFSPAVPEMDGILSQEFNFTPKGSAIPLEVVADVVRGGGAAFGNFFVAYNLPNNRRVHEQKGSKKVFSATMMQAKFDRMTGLIIDRVMNRGDAEVATFDKQLLFVLAHELAHGLGPSFIERDGRQIPFETLLGDLHTCIEEAKADMLGARLLGHFRDKGLLSDDTLAACLIAEVGTWFRTWRTGFKEAHARGHLMQYNWLKSHKAVFRDPGNGRIAIDVDAAFKAMCQLSNEFIVLQAAGDYEKAKAFVEQWTTVPDEVGTIVSGLTDLPMAVIPIYDTSHI